MAKFCGKCGSKLDEATGFCPNCDAEKIKKQEEQSSGQKKQVEETAKSTGNQAGSLNKKDAKKKQKEEKKADKKDRTAEKRQKREEKIKKKEKGEKPTDRQKVKRIVLKFVLLVFIIFIVSGGILGVLNYYGVIRIPYVNEVLQRIGLDSESSVINNGADSYTVTAPDAEDYYSNNSQIISKIDARESDDVSTEAESCIIFENRGFVDYPITTEYSMEGTYSDASDISSDSTTKHPIYQTYYYSENEELWTIFLINGTIVANPISYNMQSELEVQVIISENSTVTSYDSTTNKFYETIPNKSALLVVTVNRIDAETLESLTIEEIDHHV